MVVAKNSSAQTNQRNFPIVEPLMWTCVFIQKRQSRKGDRVRVTERVAPLRGRPLRARFAAEAERSGSPADRRRDSPPRNDRSAAYDPTSARTSAAARPPATARA